MASNNLLSVTIFLLSAVLCCCCSTTITHKFNDQFTNAPYQLDVTVPSCDPGFKNTPIQLSLTTNETLSSVMFMYQFGSRCDVRHCDCSAPVEGVSNHDGTNFSAYVQQPQTPENQLNVYMLYTSSAWTNGRHQYPIDALPHQFLSTQLPCETASYGPCDPLNCFINITTRGCSN